jgi:hypothetical protein
MTIFSVLLEDFVTTLGVGCDFLGDRYPQFDMSWPNLTTDVSIIRNFCSLRFFLSVL